MKQGLATAWRWYLIPGVFLGGIKMTSVLLWSAFWPFDALFGFSENLPSFWAGFVIMALGLINAALTVVAWPITVYRIAAGQISVWTALFYPFAQG